jgi:hypothetical protein
MNKRKLQEFSSWAKQNLEKQIELSLKKIGINSDNDIKQSRVQGEVTIIEGIETSFKKKFNDQRLEIINLIKNNGFRHTIEQFASTWFNRIVALRFLEVHNYLDHGFKLFPNEPNTLPEILTKLSLVKEDLNLDINYIEELKSGGSSNEEMFRYVIFQQCNALSKALPMLFSSGMSYLEYFIPAPLLFGDTIINKIIEIDEADFKEDVEIIGWLYQFYVSFLREKVRSKKKTEQNDIPILTQVFTPDWIVKYMAENSIGRVWLESFPSSPLKYEMKYYIDELKQEPEVEEKLKLFRFQYVNPEEIKIIEPCSGSGHILVYCFDLLLKMYKEKGYNNKDIPALILNNNLVGLDIDQRATQLASFSLVMRARSIDSKFFEEGRYVRPKVYEIVDSKALNYFNYNGKSYKEIILEFNSKQWVGENQLTADELKEIDYLVDLFYDAKVTGSLLKVNTGKYLIIHSKLSTNFKYNTKADIFTTTFFDHEFRDLLDILRVAYFMAQKYDVMITNPPYIGISTLDSNPKDYLSKNYAISKSDMFSMFMENPLVKKNGFRALVNPDSWMFLKSFEKLRLNILNNEHIINMTHHGMGEFDAVVQTTSFVIRNCALPEYTGTYYRLVDSKKKEKDFLLNVGNIKFFANSNKFLKIPGFIYAFWLTERNLLNFSSPSLGTIAVPKTGLKTGITEKYVLSWSEVLFDSIGFNIKNRNEALDSKKKWFPASNGGSFRKWYGNNYDVVNWFNDGYEIRNLYMPNGKLKSRPQNMDYYFKFGLTWSALTSGSLSVRISPIGNIISGAGYGVFNDSIDLLPLLGLLNSSVIDYITKILSSTLNNEVGTLEKIPVNKDIFNNFVKSKVVQCVNLAKNDWDTFETSWDFKKHPLIGSGTLSQKFSDFKLITKSNFETLKSVEEELNDYLINLYGLQKELIKDINNSHISISIANKERDVKSLISYLIGILMGRYSLSEEGLIFAGGTFDIQRYGNHDVDSNGIIPIYSDISIKDGLVNRITGLIKDIYGMENYRDNVGFIAEALGKKSNETSEETLNRYLNDSFYQDHLKTYNKRPIYWMFSSVKSNAFKFLIYIHRYNKDTIAKINAGYFQPATTILRNKIKEIESNISIAGDIEKRNLEKKRLILLEQLNEALDYGQVLDYMANKYLVIDLDDGVKVNYSKFQGIEVTTNNGKSKIDLLATIK